MNYICAELPSGKWRVYAEENGTQRLLDTFDDDEVAANYLIELDSFDENGCEHQDWVDTMDGNECRSCGQTVSYTKEDE